MGFNEEYAALRKKRKKDFSATAIERQAEQSLKATSTKSTKKDDDDDIAPVKETKTTTEEPKKRTWFQGGEFEDGYQFGDVFKTVRNTSADVMENLTAGILGIGESVVDAGAYVAGGVGKLFGADKFADKTKKFIAKDTIDEKKIARVLLTIDNPLGMIGTDTEKGSLFGDKTDSVVQSGGQLVGTVALQSVGVPWFVTTGVTSFGGETENAFNQGASYGEAGASAAITAGAEILTEKLSGGIKFGGKALDDVLTKELTRGISNKAVRTMAKLGMDVVGEGSEEVISQVISNLGTSLYEEENLEDILFSEEALDEYLESFIGGAVLGGVGSGTSAVNSAINGRDSTSGMTANEEKVFKKVYEDRIAEAEEGGKKLNFIEKNKIHEEVIKDMENGRISTDTIESVLGGETYKAYQDTIESEENAIKELETLYEGDELTQAVNDILENSQRTALKQQLSREVSELAMNSKDSFLSESYNEAARRKEAFTADLAKYDTKTQEHIKKAIDSGVLNNTRRTHEFVDMIAKISTDKGVLFDYTNNAKLKESGFAVDGKFVNGFVTKDGVTVNIDSQKALNSIVGHEITHVLEGTEFYKALQDTIFEYANMKGIYKDRLKSTLDLYKDVKGYEGYEGYKAIKREVVSDLVGDYLFTDADFINNLSTKNRNVFQKVYDEIKYLCKVATAGSKEARELERVKHAFEQAYRADGKANGDTKYSLSDSDGKQLTKEQQDYFKDSKMRDDNGNLKVMYHGSQDAGFHTFDSDFSDDGTSFFFVDRNDVAASYSGTTETYEAQTIRTADDMNKFIKSIDAEGYEVVEKGGKFTLLYEGERVADSNTAQGIYDEFCWYEGVGEGDANYKVYLNIKNPLVVDADGRNWNRLTSEFSQEIYDRIKSLTAEEREALHDLAGWEDSSVFRDEIQTAVESVERGASYVDDHIRNLASAAEKLGDSDMYRLFDIASDNFTEESLKENAVQYLKTRDYAQRAKKQGYDGVIFKNIVDNGGYADGTEGASTVAIAFESNQIKSVANNKPTAKADIRYSLSEDSEGRELPSAVKKRFANSKVVDENGSLKVVYHGTATGEFSIFDKSKGSVEGDFGSGFYFTDNEADVSEHYEGGGPDFENKVARRAEQIELEEEIDYDEAEERAREELFKGAHKFEVYLNIENPAIVGETILLDGESYREEYNEEDYDDYDDYIADVEQLLADDIENIVLEVDQNCDLYSTDGIADVLWNAYYDGGIGVEELKSKLNDLYLEDSNGNFVANEVARQIIESLGYDGIIDNTVSSKFRNMGIEHGTTHYIVFKPNQIKAVTNQNPTDNPDIHLSLSEKGKAPKSYGKYNVYGKDVRLENDIAPVSVNSDTNNDTKRIADFPDDIAPMTEEETAEMQNERLDSISDLDAPPEVDAPYYEENETATPDDPFESRDIKDVGNQKVKAYMYENPEVKPFFQEEANVMLGELQRTTKGERWYNDQLYYETNGARGFGGVSRQTSNDIAYLLDEQGYTYAEIEKGLKAIIEDNGKENNACSKRIEFLLNDRLLKGYQDMDGMEIPANDDYIRLLNEKQIMEYNDEARKKFFEVEDDFAPYVEAEEVKTEQPKNDSAAPVSREVFNNKVNAVYNQIKGLSAGKYHKVDDYGFHLARGKDHATITVNTPDGKKLQKVINGGQYWKNGRLWGEAAKMVAENDFPNVEQAKPEEVKKAKIVTHDQDPKKKDRSALMQVRTHLFDDQSVIEDLALKTNNRELDAKANFMRHSEEIAQHFIGNGADGVRAITDLKAEVEESGFYDEFQEYMYDLHNTDRMSIEDKAQQTIARLHSKFEKLRPEQIHAIAGKEITDKTTEKTAQTIKDARAYLDAQGAKNLPVFGYEYTAEMSSANAARLEAEHPIFKEWAQDIYNICNFLREQLVKDAEISRETADLWAELYPHYIPIRRLDKSGVGVSVALDTNKTGVNAPVKRATGGDSDIGDLFKTLAMRAEQTFKAGTINRFGLELMNTLGTRIEQQTTKATLDEAIDGIENTEGRLKKGENGMNPTFTVFENGERVEFEITEDLYDALKPTNDLLNRKIPVLSHVGEGFKKVLTEYNPAFAITNTFKDAQDILMNSQHPLGTYAEIPNAAFQLIKGGKWAKEYAANGAYQETHFERTKNGKDFKAEDSMAKKVLGFPLHAFSKLSKFSESVPRLAEYIASRKAGRSIEVSMLDADRVTTNFKAGGDVTKFFNRNGVTFLNPSVQGFNQQVRNVREAKANGFKGWMQLAAKTIVAGVPAVLVNMLWWDDDEDYEELSDYVKQNYYIVAKFGDGQFVRIPKGRTVSVIQNALQKTVDVATGDEEADLKNFLDMAWDGLVFGYKNLAPNNPIDNNIIAPVVQAVTNNAWYGGDIVPSRLQDMPAAEQYDESTDAISKWLGEKTNLSPYKINYVLDQYSGIVGDALLPALTPEAEGGGSKLLAPIKDKFTTDSVMNNQNVSDFYDTVDELTKNANSAYATDEDILMSKYMNSVNAELGELYAQKREIQNKRLSDADKYAAVRDIQKQIDTITRESLNTYNNVDIDNGYATVGDLHYRTNKDGEWEKITDKQLEKQEKVTRGLGISASDYWSNKEEYDYAYDYPEKYAVAKSVGGYSAYKTYSSELYDIKADKDENGKSITGSRKEKVIEYVNNLDADYGEKIILFKSEYNADDTYNYEIIDYLNSRQDISYEEMETILKELGFTVDKNGNISW